MAFSWRTPVVGGASAASIGISLTGFSTGDLMLVAIAAQVGGGSCSPPAGWTETHDLVANSAVVGAAYYRIKDGTEGSTATFTLAASSGHAYAAVAGYDPAGPLAITAVTAVATSAFAGSHSNIDFAAIPAPGATGYLGIAFACPRGTSAGTHQVTTNPTGWTKVAAREPISTTPFLHPTIFIKENISSSGETPSGGTWSANCSEANAVIGIKAQLSGAAPVADFTATPLSGTASLSVAFTDTTTNTPTSWLWDFGDGGTSTSQNPSHSYTTSGVYTVSLTATNATGSNTKTRTAYITVTETIAYATGGGITIW